MYGRVDLVSSSSIDHTAKVFSESDVYGFRTWLESSRLPVAPSGPVTTAVGACTKYPAKTKVREHVSCDCMKSKPCRAAGGRLIAFATLSRAHLWPQAAGRLRLEHCDISVRAKITCPREPPEIPWPTLARPDDTSWPAPTSHAVRLYRSKRHVTHSFTAVPFP